MSVMWSPQQALRDARAVAIPIAVPVRRDDHRARALVWGSMLAANAAAWGYGLLWAFGLIG